ncbi:hypothetical protein KFK09_021154 [Dendrobium nobile]|uniref:Uncharacterized protein n=1 Tax=Dendrobium nobile TaxID=94219 RepID=A0A8T3AMY8_DENNO|nr:hypothetical protein KFK09_021154 [Dendrobium nobile]
MVSRPQLWHTVPDDPPLSWNLQIQIRNKSPFQGTTARSISSKPLPTRSPPLLSSRHKLEWKQHPREHSILYGDYYWIANIVPQSDEVIALEEKIDVDSCNDFQKSYGRLHLRKCATNLIDVIGLLRDLSYNQFNGSIPESLGQLKSLRILNLNGNLLSGRVPANLGGRPLHGASFNFTGNAGLCDIPGLPTCGPHLSIGAKVGIALGSLIAFLLFLVCLVCWWKRRQNILRIQKIAASREASYAKARTNFGRDVQMTKHSSPQCSQDQSRIATEDSPALLS